MAVPRVLHVTGTMNRGGAETMLMTLYRAVDRTRLQFDFLEFSEGVSDYAPEIEMLGGRIYKMAWSQNPLCVRHTVSSLTKVLREAGPFAAVHSHVLLANGLVLAGARRAGVQCRISHSHNTSDGSDGVVAAGYRTLARSLIRRNATVLAGCSEEAGRFLNGGQEFSDGGIVIPNAVDTSRFAPLAEDKRTERRMGLGISDDCLILASVARLEAVKNHDFLLEVATELKSRRVDFRMLWIGTGSLSRELHTDVHRRRLDSHITMMGLREDVSSILQICDAVLMPSLYEGIPVALIEAQASGVPCFVSDRISREVDLGLGLCHYLPITEASTWGEALLAPLPSTPDRSRIETVLAERGYSVGESLSRLFSLYPIDMAGDA